MELKPQQPKKQQASPKPKGIDRKEWRRLQKLHIYEDQARAQGFSLIAGIDEAGRGPLAGPVVAAACIIPKDVFIIGVDDSKKLTASQRKELFSKITSDSRILYGVGVIGHEETDQFNIYQATIKAMLLAIGRLIQAPEFLLVDGLKLPHPSIPCLKIIGGDGLSHSIAAASVIAKESRDRIMIEEHEKWPQYGFANHKGYSTPEHLEALKKHGPCPIHRRSFAPVYNRESGQTFFDFITQCEASTEKGAVKN
jgi:ribonuclease HII